MRRKRKAPSKPVSCNAWSGGLQEFPVCCFHILFSSITPKHLLLVNPQNSYHPSCPLATISNPMHIELMHSTKGDGQTIQKPVSHFLPLCLQPRFNNVTHFSLSMRAYLWLTLWKLYNISTSCLYYYGHEKNSLDGFASCAEWYSSQVKTLANEASRVQHIPFETKNEPRVTSH